MAYDDNWPRWVQASVSYYLKQIADDNSYPSLVEGIDERTTAFMEEEERIEIRSNGPFIKELSNDYYRFYVDVNILIHSYMDGSVANAYSGTSIAGVFAQALSDPIPIRKYGSGVDDDQSLIGCLTLRRGQREEVRVYHFGEIDREHRLRQYGVDVSLEMNIYSPDE